MAVTQQLARIRSERARQASFDEGVLASILSFEAEADEAFEDFNWFPRTIERALTVLGRVDLAGLAAQAFDGEEVLNPASADGANGYVVYSEIRVNQAVTVARLAKALTGLPVSELGATRDRLAAEYPDDELPSPYAEELEKHARMLVAFYAEAASRNQAVVSWWD